MNCNQTTPSSYDHTSKLSVKLSVLATILLLVVCGNVAIIRHFSRQRKKWSASDCLVRVLGLVGLLTGLVNISVYMLTLASGKWILGEAVCQIHGVISTLLISSWTWILAIAALERFTKLLKPSEHTCLFSEVNTKIIVWGTVLLLFVLYTAPIYGWAEYSFYRGKLDMLLGVHNISLTADSKLTSNDLSVFMPQLYGYLLNTRDSPDGVLTRLALHLTGNGEATTRQLRFTETGVKFPMRFSTREMLHCLWTNYQDGILVEDWTQILMSNLTKTSLGVSNIDIRLEILPRDVVFYEKSFIMMQESSTCGLDYTNVNDYTYSFIAFSWTCTIIVPIVLIFYCYIRVFTAGVNNLCFLSADGRSPEDARSAKIFACCSALSVSCDLPYFVTNMVAGLGQPVPPLLLFLSTVLLFFRSSLMFSLCWLSGSMASASCLRQLPSCLRPRMRRRKKPQKADRSRYHLQDVTEELLSGGMECNTRDTDCLTHSVNGQPAHASSVESSETKL